MTTLRQRLIDDLRVRNWSVHTSCGDLNHRLLSLKDGNVTFKWGDYRHANQQSLMTLKAGEFIRRFLLHVLPRGVLKYFVPPMDWVIRYADGTNSVQHLTYETTL